MRLSIQRDSFWAEAWFDLGRCYLLDGDFAAAEWAFRRAIDTAGKCVRASVELGVLLRRLGRAGEAEGYLQGRSGSGNREGPGKPNTRLRA